MESGGESGEGRKDCKFVGSSGEGGNRPGRSGLQGAAEVERVCSSGAPAGQ